MIATVQIAKIVNAIGCKRKINSLTSSGHFLNPSNFPATRLLLHPTVNLVSRNLPRHYWRELLRQVDGAAHHMQNEIRRKLYNCGNCTHTLLNLISIRFATIGVSSCTAGGWRHPSPDKTCKPRSECRAGENCGNHSHTLLLVTSHCTQY